MRCALKPMTVFLYLAIVLTSVLISATSSAQTRMDLDDLEIKGELLGDNRLQMLNREKNELKNFVEFRTNYRSEMIQGLEKPYPIYKDYPATKVKQKK